MYNLVRILIVWTLSFAAAHGIDIASGEGKVPPERRAVEKVEIVVETPTPAFVQWSPVPTPTRTWTWETD